MYCRFGCGTIDKDESPTNTEGFEFTEFDQIYYDQKRKQKFLKLKRTTSKRMNQTSKYLLQSWRANSDVQVIIYDSDPNNPDFDEIKTVSDYVVSYVHVYLK